MECIDDEWERFLTSQTSGNFGGASINKKQQIEPKVDKTALQNTTQQNEPVCQDLYISTKTKVLFLNQPVDINNIFWKIPVIEYWNATDGVVKKQMKIVSKSKEEFDEYQTKLKSIPYYTENIIKQIDNPAARRIKFKDERKITIGISKKDIMNCRGKVKNAFYNCFAIIIRFKFEGLFREIHVKIFNTGKLEIPGILNTKLLDVVKEMVLNLLIPNIETTLEFIETDSEENVLINSNFNCGYFINREKLHSILRNKYRIESAYDPCSYPGVKCKYYFNNDVGFDIITQNGQIIQEDRTMKMSELGDNKKYTEISFMIFRTGSVLIVGNCTERVLKYVFEFIKKILAAEYQNIHVLTEEPLNKNKKVKLRKKTIIMTNSVVV
uniref:Uncharacterized protein n=1 Tax=viral metagenome TaxID=1070528 RepID=A0A6C0DBU1_9ZZZZ